MALTTEQLLLLNNLMYVYEFNKSMGSFEGKTVGEFLNSIDTSSFSANSDVTQFTSGEEWNNILNAINSDTTLKNMTIASTHVDNGPNGGGGYSAVFVDESSKEAVVAFKGTETSAEWKDNFEGVTSTNMPDGVSTQHQSNALDWYQSEYEALGLDDYNVTVTGHSKGGNKAKYITVMDGSVDRCVSFDGQGFSDEFCDKYHDEIYERSDKIENHNVDSDPVNILINDIGETHYYEGHTDGGGLFENHCPNAFFEFDEDGSYRMTEGEQDPVMEEIDNYLNSLIRSMPPEDRAEAAMLVNELRAHLLNNDRDKSGDINYLIEMLATENSEITAYIIAFTAEYIQNHPDLENTINEILDSMNVEGSDKLISALVTITQWEHFDKIIAILGKAAGVIPDWLLDEIIELIEEKTGIKLSREEARALLEVIEKVPDAQKKITSVPDGSDKSDGSFLRGIKGVVENIIGVFNSCSFEINIDGLRVSAEKMGTLANELYRKAEMIRDCRMDHTMGMLFNARIRSHAQKFEKEANLCNQVKETLMSVCDMYSKTEAAVQSID